MVWVEDLIQAYNVVQDLKVKIQVLMAVKRGDIASGLYIFKNVTIEMRIWEVSKRTTFSIQDNCAVFVAGQGKARQEEDEAQ
jgi:hypothetical protein